ncbi:hypothetical protein F4811DRAFT_547723 [Daldinia bambusicola]|nr:hypothetical protein F4811DRAFT_547723 [Daldinia bambusicola]
MSSGSQLVKARDLSHALKQLDEVLASTVENDNRCEVVALTTDIGAGKSTSVLDHIWKRAKAGRAPPKLIYLVSTDTEAAWLQTHLVKTIFTPDEVETRASLDGRPIVIRSVRQYAAQFDEISRYKHCTVIVDVNWYPTVEDEMAFALLLSLAAEARTKKGEEEFRMCYVLFMSAFESRRTVAAFEKWVGHVLRLDCTGFNSPNINIETAREGWEKQLQNTLSEVLPHKRVIMGADRLWGFDGIEDGLFDSVTGEVMFDRFREDEDTVGEKLQVLEASPLVVVDPDTPFSTRIENLGMFVSPGVIHKDLLTPGLMQIVLRERRLRWHELLRHYSWVKKSSEISATSGTSGPSNIRFLCPASDEDLKAREVASEDLGRAWNVDFMFTVLAFLYGWHDRRINCIPMRRPANDYVFAEAVNRLYVLGCIRKSTKVQGGYECTTLGDKIMDSFFGETKHRHNFHLMYLLCRVQLRQGESSEVRRVIARLAAVAYQGPRWVFSVDEDAPTTQRYRDSLPPVIQGRAHAGALWVGAGICASLEAAGVQVQDDISETIRQGCFLVSVENVREVICRAKQFEAILGLEPVDTTDWINTPLDEAQLRSIDEDMMWSWLHRICLVQHTPLHSNIVGVVDCVSFEDFQANMAEECLRAQDVRKHCWTVTAGGGDFCAFYLSLEEEKGQVWARDLTWVPPQAIQDVPKKTNTAWPEVVLKMFKGV